MSRKSYNDLKAGLPSGDERTQKIRMFSAGYAYFISLYIWIVLLAFHKYLDSDDLLKTIVFLEKGDYNPSLQLAAKVARILNSAIEEIFIFEDSDLE